MRNKHKGNFCQNFESLSYLLTFNVNFYLVSKVPNQICTIKTYWTLTATENKTLEEMADLLIALILWFSMTTCCLFFDTSHLVRRGGSYFINRIREALRCLRVWTQPCSISGRQREMFYDQCNFTEWCAQFVVHNTYHHTLTRPGSSSKTMVMHKTPPTLPVTLST